jgi:hypothetical protein
MLLLFINVVLTAGLTFYYIQSIRYINYLQPARMEANVKFNLLQGLLAECSEYAKRDPSIVPVMQFQTPRPAAKQAPATKK